MTMTDRSREIIEAIQKANDAAVRAWPATTEDDSDEPTEALLLASSRIIESDGAVSIMAGDQLVLACSRYEFRVALEEQARWDAWPAN